MPTKIAHSLADMTRDQRSLLTYFETCLVDNIGAVDGRRINAEDHIIAKQWDAEGFLRFGRIYSKHLAQGRTHWVKFTPEAWTLAHAERIARAVRNEPHRTWNRTDE